MGKLFGIVIGYNVETYCKIPTISTLVVYKHKTGKGPPDQAIREALDRTYSYPERVDLVKNVIWGVQSDNYSED